MTQCRLDQAGMNRTREQCGTVRFAVSALIVHGGWRGERAAADVAGCALASAYSNNPTLQSARAQLRATDEGVPQALAGWRPTIVLSSSAGYADGSYQSSANWRSNEQNPQQPRFVHRGRRRRHSRSIRGGATQAGTRQADNRVFGQRARLLATEQQLFSDTVNAYVNVIQTQQVLQLNINNEQVLGASVAGDAGPLSGRRNYANGRGAGRGGFSRGAGDAGNGAGQACRPLAGRIGGMSASCQIQLVEPQPLKQPVHRTSRRRCSSPRATTRTSSPRCSTTAAARDNIDLQFANLNAAAQRTGAGGPIR